MLIFLAESKTMSAEQKPVEPELFENNKPVFEDIADSLMSYLESLPTLEISEILGISHQLSVKTHNLAYDFPHKNTGYKALYGFTGEAYRGLDVSSLSSEAIERAEKNLKIISSVYGLLNASDIIKPYRCEFNKPIYPDSKTAINIFKPKLTVEVVKKIKNNGIKDIINLLPGDADKCLDWKIIRAFASVHKVCFQTITQDGKLKTPTTQRLKEMRGTMAREILNNDIRTFEQLKEFRSDHFIFSKADSKNGLPVFITN
ncbi:MAG: YaaA family protein [Muribaculaceae bacterium]|nr:YaaA family protein [Muribaculaceae bacterium]